MSEPLPDTEPATLRLFVACELPEDWRAELMRQQRLLQRRLGEAAGALRWVGPETFHLTLLFLGTTPVEREAEVQAALRAGLQGVHGCTVGLGPPGTFGGREPRVLWSGLTGELACLERLHQRVVEALAADPDDHFAAHVTLARVRERRRVGAELRAALASWPAVKAAPFRIRAVSLMRSELQRSGAVYTRRLLVPLSED